MLENTEGAIKKVQSRETANKMKENKAKTQHNMCWTPLCERKTKKPTNNVNKTYTLHQTIWGKDEPNRLPLRYSLTFII
jgi:hypothetical protein